MQAIMKLRHILILGVFLISLKQELAWPSAPSSEVPLVLRMYLWEQDPIRGICGKELADDMVKFPESEAILKELPDNVKGYSRIQKLPDEVKLSRKNIETAADLEKLKLHNNDSEVAKRIPKIVNQIDKSQFPNAAQTIRESLSQGKFNDSDGYKKMVEKCGISSSFHTGAKQAIDDANDAVANGIDPKDIEFEAESASYDIDFAVKGTNPTKNIKL